VKPWKTLETSGELKLKERGGEYLITVHGAVLMGSRNTGSELALAREGCSDLRTASPRVLIGGLGFGATLRAALDVLPPAASVTVAEISPAVVAWNRGLLAPLHQSALKDPRVTVVEGDVQKELKRGWNVVLLDVDNGPYAVSRPQNAALYAPQGLGRIKGGLAAHGTVGFWSASDDLRFRQALSRSGFSVQVKKTGTQAVIFLARAQ
jgi:spermidine synthase